MSWTTGQEQGQLSGQPEDMVGTRVVMSAAGRIELARIADARAVAPLADLVAQDMRRFVPILSGDLRGTIRRVDEGQVWFGDVDGGVDYHLFQEFGTSKMSAQPYARPAIYKIRTL